jgi:adhesin/invasin
MSRLNMNTIYRSVILLFCTMLFTSIYGCGNGGGGSSSSGTSGTTTKAGHNIALSANVTTLAAGQNSIITATVTDGAGNPASGQTVSFQFLGGGAAPSGATLTPLSSGITDASGKAIAIYTAGATISATDIQDTVQASVTGATNAILMTRTASATPPSEYRMALAADVTTLAAGQNSIVTATVTDGAGNPASGQTVSFQFLGGVAAPSGATLTPLNSGITDASGKAVAVYTAGAASPTTGVQDTIQVSVTGATGALVMTRTASTSVPPTGYRMALAADVTSLAAGQSTIITATVTDSSGNPASGQTVSFQFLDGVAAPSGATLTTLGSGITDASGRAITVYKAGANAATTSIQDTIQASVTGTTSGIVMTRTASTAVPPAGNRMALTADVTSLAAGQHSIITATVTDSSGNPVSGQTVSFQFLGGATAPSGATLTPLNSGTTDASGKAVAVYTAGATTPATSVQDMIQASVTGATGAITMTRTASTAVPPAGYRIALAADLTSLSAGQNTIVTATVTDGSGNPAIGQTVSFQFLGGLAAPSGATLTTLNGGVTDANGKVVAIYTAGAASPAITVQDMVQASVTGTTGALVMTRTASTAVPPAGYRITVSADVTSLGAGVKSIVTATVTDGSGNPASGQTVTFQFLGGLPAPSDATLSVLNGGITDASGRAVAVYTAGANTPAASIQDTIQASVTGSTDVAIITRTANTATPPSGYRLTVTATPTDLSAGAMSVVAATVFNADGTAAVGVPVTFAFGTNNSGATLTTVGVGTTDVSGTAIATYTAGNNTPSLSIQDTVTASVTGSANAAVITRLPTVGTGDRIISFTEDPETTVSGTPGPLPAASAVVIMKVKVTKDDLVSPVQGEAVTFSIINGNGTLTFTDPTSAVVTSVSSPPVPAILAPVNPVVTDDNGEAYVVFTKPGAGSPSDTIIRAQIESTTNGGDAVRIIYW